MKQFKPQTGGHRLYLDEFILIQEAYKESLKFICEGFNNPFNNPFKLNGVAVTTQPGLINISAGAIYFAGEIFRFDGSQINIANYASTFFKIEEQELSPPDPIEYADQTLRNNIHVDRVLITKTFDSNDGDINNVNGFYLSNLTEKNVHPKGIIIDWIPIINTDFDLSFDSTGLGINKMSGWAICNGSNGTPDLRGRRTVMATLNMKTNAPVDAAITQAIPVKVKGGQIMNQLVIETYNLPDYLLQTTVTTNNHTHSYEIYTDYEYWVGRGAGSNTYRAPKWESKTTVQTGPANANVGVSVRSGGEGVPMVYYTNPPFYGTVKIIKLY